MRTYVWETNKVVMTRKSTKPLSAKNVFGQKLSPGSFFLGFVCLCVTHSMEPLHINAYTCSNAPVKRLPVRLLIPVPLSASTHRNQTTDRTFMRTDGVATILRRLRIMRSLKCWGKPLFALHAQKSTSFCFCIFCYCFERHSRHAGFGKKEPRPFLVPHSHLQKA